MARTLAAKRRQRIDPDQALIGLGAANIGAGLSGGYPVTGGFARSVVIFDAGAETPAAGMFTALGFGLATLTLTPVIHHLPVATLAATIIVAVLSLVDLRAPLRVLRYSKTDFAAKAATILLTLIVGVEAGIGAGVAISVLMHPYRSARPHSAIVGQVSGTEQFRNVARHEVVVDPAILSLRVDESLYFANARFLEERVLEAVTADPCTRHLVLMCTAVNAIDASALQGLEAINHRLADSGETFHLSAVKGPVMDRLRRTSFCETLSGRVFLTQYDAFHALAPQLAEETSRGPRCGLARTA